MKKRYFEKININACLNDITLTLLSPLKWAFNALSLSSKTLSPPFKTLSPPFKTLLLSFQTLLLSFQTSLLSFQTSLLSFKTLLLSFLRKQESKKKKSITFNQYFLPLMLSFFILIFIIPSSNSESSKKSETGKNIDKPKVSKIVVTKSKFTLEVYDDKNEIIKAYKVAIGKNPGDKQRKGDMRTPVGEFKIIQIQNSKSWKYDFPDDGLGPIEGAYGPWFIRLKTPKWTGIGIHGTHDPKSIGTMSSTGCIRMRNEDIIELKNMVKIGIPVVIKE